MSKSSKKLDKEIEAIYYANCSGVQINIMDIPKIFDAGRMAYAAGQPMAPAILAKVAELRKN
jgi:hypothetical protein